MKTPSRTGLAALGVAIALLSGCSQEAVEVTTAAPVRPVKLFTVEDISMKQVRHFPATVAASDEAEISFRVSGELVDRPLSEGQLVKQGQLLAKLDDTDARNTLADRQANYELATVDYRRKKDLVVKKALPQSDLDKAEATLKSAKAALELARSSLAYTKLTAPFAGRIAKLEAENHQYVQARQTIVVLQSDETIDLHIQVPESVIAMVSDDNYNFNYKPQVSFRAAPGKTYGATFKERANKVTQGTQSYEVVFTMEQPADMNVLPGMAATVTIDLSQATVDTKKTGYVIVPRQAVAKDDTNGRTIVWVFNEDTNSIRAADVTMGRVTDSGLEILSGLKPGDQVVAAGASQLTEGLSVKPLRWERGL